MPSRTRQRTSPLAEDTSLHAGASDRRQERLDLDKLVADIVAEERKYEEGTTSDDESSVATNDLGARERRLHRCRQLVVDRRTTKLAPTMRAVRNSLLEQNMLLVDVPGDGSCGIWSVMPAIGAALGRPTSKAEVREIIIEQLRAPEFYKDLEVDLHTTNELRRRDNLVEYEDVDDVLAELAMPDRFVPPILLMKATERFTGGRVRLWADDADKNTIPFMWTDGDDAIPFSCELVHVASRTTSSRNDFVNEAELSGGHIARVIPLPTAMPRETNAPRKRAYVDDVTHLDQVLQRINDDALAIRKLRQKMAQQ